MNYEQFAIWLHGFLEISNVESIDKNQTQIIKDHLALLFEKKTPIRREKKNINHNLCCEIPLSEIFEGVDLNTKFDTELHKNKTYC
jgi:hypothetical protein